MEELKLPTAVFVWPRRFEVRHTAVPDCNDMGQITLSDRTIYVRPGASRQEEALTLCDEVVHAMVASVGDYRISEAVAGGMAQMLFAVIRDNPEFVRYVQAIPEEIPEKGWTG